MIGLRIGQLGARSVGRILDDQVREFKRRQIRALRRAGGVVRTEIRQHIRRRFNRGRGLFIKVIGVVIPRKNRELGDLVAKVGTRTRHYYRIHEEGGIVRPRKSRPMVFPGRDGGLVHARQVRIPSRPVHGPAAESARERAIARLEDSLRALGVR